MKNLNSIKVYRLEFPDGQTYYGQSTDPVKRWASGRGYPYHKTMNDLIKKYGWSAVKKTILAEYDCRDAALFMEAAFILTHEGSTLLNHMHPTNPITSCLGKIEFGDPTCTNCPLKHYFESTDR